MVAVIHEYHNIRRSLSPADYVYFRHVSKVAGNNVTNTIDLATPSVFKFPGIGDQLELYHCANLSARSTYTIAAYSKELTSQLIDETYETRNVCQATVPVHANDRSAL
jgi:hypothetical protein